MGAKTPKNGYRSTRSVYKAVKKYDHQQFDEFCTRIYASGYEDGRNSVPGISVEDMLKTIGDIKGVGPALKGKISEAITKEFAKTENDC